MNTAGERDCEPHHLVVPGGDDSRHVVAVDEDGVASTSVHESWAIALGSFGGAHTTGDGSHAVTRGGYSIARTEGAWSHAVSLGYSTIADPEHVVAHATGRHAFAFAPHGCAYSERHIAIGVMVFLRDADSLAVLLPKGHGVPPVVVSGRTHPVGVWLALGRNGEVVEVEDVELAPDGSGEAGAAK